MKITKILMAALFLTMFVFCSQDGDANDASQTEMTAKNGGLSQKYVDELKALCAGFSTSSEFLTYRSMAAEFGHMMNGNINKNWTTRKDLETWLAVNVGQTKFATAQQGLDMFDNVTASGTVFLNANTKFFDALPGASLGQVHIILEPIAPEPPVMVAYNECMDDCVAAASSAMDSALTSWEYSVWFAGNLPASQQAAYLAFADANFEWALDSAVYFGNLCLDGC